MSLLSTLDPLDAVNARQQPEQAELAAQRAGALLDRVEAGLSALRLRAEPFTKPALAALVLSFLVVIARRRK